MENINVLIKKPLEVLAQMHHAKLKEAKLLWDEISAIGEAIFEKERCNTQMQDSGLFKPWVDENLLADAFREVYGEFFGDLPTERLDGLYNRSVDLIAYFFIIVERHKWGNSVFSEKGKKPFFEFCKNTVLLDDIKATSRTFNNRLSKTMDEFRSKLIREPINSGFKRECWKNDIHLKNFLRVDKLFHETHFFHMLERKRNK